VVHPSPRELARLACVLEVTARKPGNVHRVADFDDASYVDFLLSADAAAEAIGRASIDGVGASILGAVEATRRVARSNTNLGLILLLTPLAAVPAGADLRSGVAAVLDRLTVDDARLAYRAIRLANPGGLGRSGEQDVGAEPTVPLREAMRLAAGRDDVARQYATGYEDIFTRALSLLKRDLDAGRTLEAAIVGLHLRLMAARSDTLIHRKRGAAVAAEASRRAAAVLDAGWPDAPGARERLAAFDRWLRADGRGRNPGTTADLVGATLYAALYDGTITPPIDGPRQFAIDQPGLSGPGASNRPN
jgi:triphosphoribosyl-dephospho-CoA synthase